MNIILTAGIGAIISILAIFFLVYMAVKGWHNGIVHSLAGIIVFVAAVIIANKAAAAYSPQFTKAIEPMITGIVDDASLKAIGEKARTEKDENGETVELPIEVPREYDGTVRSACVLSFKEMGFDSQLSERFAGEIARTNTEVDAQMREQITVKTAAVISYALVFLVLCAVILIAAGAMMNLFNLIIHFPEFDIVSRIGGAAVSVMIGFLALYGVCWILRFCGAFLPESIFKDSSVLAFFFKDNPLQRMTLY